MLWSKKKQLKERYHGLKPSMRKQANIIFLVNSDLYADADHAVHVFHVRSTSDDDVHEYGFSGSPAIIPDHAQWSVFFGAAVIE